DGKWKALRRGLKTKNPQNWELYNIEVDREEKNNIAAQYPEIVQRLEKAWLASRTVEPDFPVPLIDK
ncbi:MAG: sulfatase, partial [Verrucomicrobiota bacterium]|nr:sulfatase [Verrucomicrobiota bacterium]